MIAKQNGKRVTKFDIAKMIEELPGNTPWGYYSMMSIYYDWQTVQQLAETYNRLISERNLPFEQIIVK